MGLGATRAETEAETHAATMAMAVAKAKETAQKVMTHLQHLIWGQRQLLERVQWVITINQAAGWKGGVTRCTLYAVRHAPCAARRTLDTGLCWLLPKTRHDMEFISIISVPRQGKSTGTRRERAGGAAPVDAVKLIKSPRAAGTAQTAHMEWDWMGLWQCQDSLSKSPMCQPMHSGAAQRNVSHNAHKKFVIISRRRPDRGDCKGRGEEPVCVCHWTKERTYLSTCVCVCVSWSLSLLLCTGCTGDSLKDCVAVAFADSEYLSKA